ncbi:hypothetical protein [Polaribacter sp. SA4-12]|uniref:hypothetical protein n=1 Tax=Polaribacter sp. SA4-12 TaxID=1312072 RepID=UPI000B3C9FE0|nr:hypothetical protein [Polaribacter sp. SA4-12]ARV14297.1 hypothetical protein BTO07_03630 [Polaribacter sp. SA4-12]
MKKHFFFLFTVVFTITSCTDTSKKNSIVGVYQSSKLNFIEKIKYNTYKDIKGLKLILKKDSSFHYETCGLLIKGGWNTKNDSLRLNVSDIKFVNDSINKIKKPETRKDFLVYKMEGNSFFGFVNDTNGFRINKLKRNE